MNDTPKTMQYSSHCWPRIHAVMFFLMFVLQMTQYYYSSVYSIIFPYIFSVISVTAAVAYYAARGLGDGQEIKALTVYSCWVLITRIICGHVFEESDLLFVSGMYACCFSIALAFQLNREQRQKLFNVFVLLFAGIITFTGVVGIYAAVTQTEPRIKLIGFTLELVTFKNEGGVLRLRLADSHPNNSACWAFLSLFILINRLFAVRRKWIKVIIIISAIVNYLAMALTNCRTIFMCFAICFALLVFLLIQNKTGIKKKGIQNAVFIMTLIIVTALAYKSIDVSLKTINAFSVKNVAAQTLEDDTLFEDSRDVFGENSTLSPRVKIWKSIPYVLKKDPMILLRGSAQTGLMDVSCEVTKFDPAIGHYHNMFLNILMLTGVPGLIIVLAFLYILIRKILLLLFSRKEEASLAEKTLALPLIGLIGYGATLEVLLFTETDIRAFAFFFIAGIMLADYRDLEIGK